MYTLLIVDDEPLMRRGVKSLVNLSAMGIDKVLEASNGEEALTLVESTEPDFALLDINMPKMDGLTCANALKARYPDVSIAMITGYDYFEYVRTALRAGVDDYLLKPITKNEVEALLVKLIAMKTAKAVSRELEGITQPGQQTDMLDSQVALLKEAVDKGVFTANFTLGQLADALGYSGGYVSGWFKQVYGQTFQDYVIDRRMAQAKRLLLTSDMKNYEIAEAIGIEDVNYFATRFKRTFGITPQQYKKQVRGQG